jgi:hypothetical protein
MMPVRLIDDLGSARPMMSEPIPTKLESPEKVRFANCVSIFDELTGRVSPHILQNGSEIIGDFAGFAAKTPLKLPKPLRSQINPVDRTPDARRRGALDDQGCRQTYWPSICSCHD